MPRATEAEKRAQAKYQKKPEQVRKRVARNKARRTLIREGKVKVGDGKDVNHRDGNANNNSRSNWQVQSRSANRSFPRTKSAGKRNPRD
jgi:hypothetical protein